MTQTPTRPTNSVARAGSRVDSIPAPTIRDPDLERPVIFVNGEFKTKNEAAVSVYDHGLLYGDGIFEGIRVYKGKIFKCGQHMDRLWRSAKAIRLEVPVSREEMIAIQRRCIEINEIENGYIRLVITRGVGTLGLNPFKCPEPGIICIADQISLYPPEMYEKGMTVCISQRPRVPIRCLDPRVKSLNYLNNIMAKCESLDRGLLESVMLNIDGFVAECTGDNIFAIKDGVLFTPPGDAGILEGITRRFIMDTVAPACGFPVEERLFRPIELIEADEVFLTGSAAEMIAVTSIVAQDPAGNDVEHVIGADRSRKVEGPMTREMRAKFREIVTGDDIPED
ncbi:MAG: branched-chain-amino-acid transaminase [Phycisphaeraceae bacterium]|nr:MAG: branched-chain-amino-acid transaminase [Phycisphaeraceae bacterium]